MKYIIMCGGSYQSFKNPRWLMTINGEVLIERTIRQLHNLGITDLYISTNFPEYFKYLNIPILTRDNSYEVIDEVLHGYWVDAFIPLNIPICYLCGDVWYSDEALQKIINTDTDDVLFFGTQSPFAIGYYKYYEEPLAFKVVNQKKFKEGIRKTKYLQDHHLTNRNPISWELYRVLNGYDPNKHIMGNGFIGVHDFAIDIDSPDDLEKVEKAVKTYLGSLK